MNAIPPYLSSNLFMGDAIFDKNPIRATLCQFQLFAQTQRGFALKYLVYGLKINLFVKIPILTTVFTKK